MATRSLDAEDNESDSQARQGLKETLKRQRRRSGGPAQLAGVVRLEKQALLSSKSLSGL